MASDVKASGSDAEAGCGRGGAPSMKTMGLLTGLSYVSGIDYYRGINQQVAKLLPRGAVMERNSEMVIVSLDCDGYVELLTAQDTPGVCEYLFRGVRKLHAAGVDFLVIASNTAHICHDLVRQRLPELPVLHIADCTAAACRGQGRIGLLGTEPTMRDGSWLKSRLALHGIEVTVPAEAADRQRCYDIICQELSFDVFTDASRAFFVDLVRRLHSDGGATGGVILGCTEIELLVRQEDVPDVPLYRSAELHIQAAARVQAGAASLEEYLPPPPRE
eukprot:TRINITY_DN46987_c0_g1_i2.p1 TRINITY_DN46987_c0_g1~~TRINITY_DN46987_c0_g1_i2.p1  ORF type:complete len:297 (+),score=69.49 TRINITY_DN46987_c0_g1_i2:68-892(+)